MESTFFAGTHRRVTIGPPTLLVGKNKTRKIKLPLTMPLSGESVVSMPEWLSEAYEAVAQCANQLTPPIEQIPDVALTFHNPTEEAGAQLFETEDAKAPASELKKFLVMRMGDAEEPDVMLKFVVYTAFSRALWKWLGEMAGEEVKVKFPSTKSGAVEAAPAPAEQIQLTEAEQIEADRAEACKPEHDAEFGVTMRHSDDMPEDPSLEEELGEDYEDQVRKSMGAPEPMPEGTRLVDARPGRGNGRRGKGNGSTLAVN